MFASFKILQYIPTCQSSKEHNRISSILVIMNKNLSCFLVLFFIGLTRGNILQNLERCKHGVDYDGLPLTLRYWLLCSTGLDLKFITWVSSFFFFFKSTSNYINSNWSLMNSILSWNWNLGNSQVVKTVYMIK